ncbi:MAG: tetratricopeptide repeat protein [Candidatus Gastranaerophilales bacterium]|nr:tetratricopeptide repeat protein [Candidatus Gastranaerophilales bacterium]
MVAINNIQQNPIQTVSKIPSQQENRPNKTASAAAVESILSSTSINDSKTLLQEGNTHLRANEFDKAIDCYKKSIELRPDYVDTFYQMGKAYRGMEDYTNAISSLETYTAEKNKDTDAIIMLGECYSDSGYFNKAKAEFSKAITLDPANDLAKRNLKETDNLILSCFAPEKAMKQRQEQAYSNLSQALKMCEKYLSPSYFKDMGDLTVCFDKTAKLGGTSNIAQYENTKQKISVTDSYVYAAPEIVTAYLVHEFVHAKDNDPYTSVREEQDAYQAATEFWVKNSDGINDPEMDYAANLYKENPQKLANRVEEIYKLRDPKIAMTSPNHPKKGGKINASALTQLNNLNAANAYNVIS